MNNKLKELFSFSIATKSRSHIINVLKLFLRVAVLIVLLNSCEQPFNLKESLNGTQINNPTSENNESPAPDVNYQIDRQHRFRKKNGLYNHRRYG